MKKYILSISLLIVNFAQAGEADVIFAKAACSEDRVCNFFVSVKHNDTGWNHYANKWDILTPNNKIIKTRILHHPHVKEQPFTRNLSNVSVPKGFDYVIIRAHDNVHKYGGKEFKVYLK